MEKSLNELYQSVILAHNKTPHNFKKAEELPLHSEAYNPLCGDHFQLYTSLEEEVIQQAFFHGYGCAVSKASTSVLLQTIEGKTLTEAKILIEVFMQVVNGELPANIPEEFKAFAAAKHFPSREQCATLSWQAFQTLIDEQSQ
ncbi:Fe-S cluster assembly sulfur transfer protein SufU [uncultured Microscilla sp.]|uniref:Fe-S cluster assembly sulfur transfer protein SufU n=1 Tax=uncultured Microscilla sp. TaxID=432653 RepID=UPI0026238A28|nr:SUF system NifU family Fe-S cluster assembly protein [uncultured Microscilla sp.]